jgi:beta-glucosidase
LSPDISDRSSGASRTFPDEFVWGAATAAYQIEGASSEDGRGASIWDTFSHTPGKVKDGNTGDVAADHYHRLEQDLDLMAELGLQAYRFSVAWPRVQPSGRGTPNPKGLDFYRRLIEGLRARSIVPFATLYHWDLPQELQDQGGWPARDVAERFGEYAAIVARAFGDVVEHWITLNEPWCAAWLGYGMGVHAPGIADSGAALAATHHLLLGHARALDAIRAERAASSVGLALNVAPVRPADDSEGSHGAARRVDGYLNRLYLDPLWRGQYPEDVAALFEGREPGLTVVRAGDMAAIQRPVSFLGINYYSPQWVREAGGAAAGSLPEIGAQPALPADAPTTAMGWPIAPDGLTELLGGLSSDYDLPPIYITENGAAFDDAIGAGGRVHDPQRVGYLDRHLRALHDSLDGGVDVRGYFVWSLMDNFEWAEGFSRRFGLVFVDYATQRRIPKTSFDWYREVIARNGLEAL